MIVRYTLEARDYSCQTGKGNFTITETHTQENNSLEGAAWAEGPNYDSTIHLLG